MQTASPTFTAPSPARDDRNAGSDPVKIASRLDALFCAQHPGITECVRPMIAGEFRSRQAAVTTHVFVEQIIPGLRTRTECHLAVTR